MSPPQQQQQPTTLINSNSLKIQLAYRFLYNLNNLNTKRLNFDNTQIHRRSNRVKIAAYASMAAVVGSRRAWSRAILSKIRNRVGLSARIKKRVDYYKTTSHHRRRHTAGTITTRRIIRNYPNKRKRRRVEPIGGYLGQEEKLRKLVPGAKSMDECCLLDETADYMKCLATQVEVMRTLVDLYSTIS